MTQENKEFETNEFWISFIFLGFVHLPEFCSWEATNPKVPPIQRHHLQIVTSWERGTRGGWAGVGG